MKRLLCFFTSLLSVLSVNSQINSPNGDNFFYYNGSADVTFRFSERGSGGRAFVHAPDNVLALNYEEDFNGGTMIGKNVYFKENGNSYISSGNFGIGTLTPKSRLDVVGSIGSFNAAFGQLDEQTSTKNYANFSTNNHGSVLMSSNLYFSDNDDLKIAKTHPSMSGAAITMPGNGRANQGAILFYTNSLKAVMYDDAYSGVVSMAIMGNGNVGIGKASPNNKLDVNGTIHSKEVKVDMTGWSDFVFKKGYELPTLEEVENHIKEKGHLENIPSEEEVLKNGISLGEMNAKLLQKIEELTLYLIAQEKRNNLQSMEINGLKKANEKYESILKRLESQIKSN